MRDIRRIRIRYTAGVVCIFLCISLLLAGCQGRAGEVIPVLEMTETDEDTEADETDQMNEDQGENREGSSEDMNMDKENAIQDVEYDPDQEFYITEITDEIFDRMEGKSYKTDCTLPREDLKYLHVLHYDLHGEVQEGEMVVNTHIAEDVLEILRELYDAEYPIEKIRLVDEYNAEDELSMEDNNSSSFNFRFISYTTTVSKHGLGLAVDINPLYNPYVKMVNGMQSVEPITAEAYLDRTADFPCKIDENDLCYQLFTEHGFEWGGHWQGSKDYQHFEVPSEKIREWYP